MLTSSQLVTTGRRGHTAYTAVAATFTVTTVATAATTAVAAVTTVATAAPPDHTLCFASRRAAVYQDLSVFITRFVLGCVFSPAPA